MTLSNQEESAISLLTELLEDKKAFLDKGCNTAFICGAIGCNSRILPQIVKKKYGIGINRLINQYRIRHSIDLIDEGYLRKLTVESLALEVGFRFRNTFYLAFKKETGLSPSIFVDSVVDVDWVEIFRK